MTSHQTFAARAAIGIMASVAAAALCSRKEVLEVPWRTFCRRMLAAFTGSRILFFTLIYGVLHIAPRGDVPTAYVLEASEVIAGHMPYRDYISSYAPLHPYMDAALLHLWYSSLCLILFSMLGEGVLFALCLRGSRYVLPEPVARIASLLYLASVVSLQFVTIDGQDTVLVTLSFTAALLFFYRRKPFLSGLALALSVCLLKFLPLILIPLFLVGLYASESVEDGAARPTLWVAPLQWILGFACATLPVYGWALAKRLPILMPLQNEGSYRTAGNLPFFIESMLGQTLPGRLWDGITVVAFLVVPLVVFRATRGASIAARTRAIAFGSLALTFSLILLSKKSWSPYLMLALFPFCVLVAQQMQQGRRRWLVLWGFTGFCCLAVLAPSYWSSMICSPFDPAFCQPTALFVHELLKLHHNPAMLFVPIQILLLGGLAWYLWMTMRACADTVDTARRSSRQIDAPGD